MKFYKQLEGSDCGATSLKMICSIYNKDIDINYLRRITSTTKNGITIDSILKSSKILGFNSCAVKLTFEDIYTNSLFPAILHWKGNHFVVVYGKDKKENLLVADPAFGKISLNKDDFNVKWNINDDRKGIAVFLEPTDQFYSLEYKKEKTDLKYFYKNIFKHKSKFLLLLSLIILTTIISFIFPFINQRIIDNGVLNKNINIVILLFLSQIILYTSSNVINFIQDYIILKIRIHLNIDILTDFFKKMMLMPMSFFENKLMADLLLRIDDNERIEELISSSSLNFLVSCIIFLAFSGVFIYYSPIIFIIFLVLSILSICWVMWFNKKRKVLNYNRFEIEAINKNLLYEMIIGISDIKINNSEKFKINEWENLQKRLYKVNREALKYENLQTIGAKYITDLKNISILACGAYLVIKDEFSVGTLLSISFILGQLNAPINFFTTFLYTVQDAKISLERLSTIYKSKDEKQISNDILSESINDDIKFKKISFSYPSNINKLIFEDFNLNIPKNKTTAIVGSSGSGKTTLIKLLMKYYSVSEGYISINNKKLEGIDYNSWREKISVVFQDGFIFSDSLVNNIIMGKDFDEEFFWDIIKKSRLTDFLNDLPQKHLTKIGDNGLSLSKGQEQRILIARAMYKNSEIIILDEATSALDSENEKIIHENIHNHFKNKTMIIIAHRLSTVKSADKIVVLNKGKVTESGTHYELISNRREYYDLVKNQLELSE